jgi:hypothetical protein
MAKAAKQHESTFFFDAAQPRSKPTRRLFLADLPFITLDGGVSDKESFLNLFWDTRGLSSSLLRRGRGFYISFSR